MLISLSMLFAAQEMSVTWEWLLDDPEVNYYRYQLNGTEDDGWTVVSGDTGVYVAEGLDPYADYTLYLQRSYDGINWSETASATAEALLVEEVPVVEEAVEETPAIEEAPVEEVVIEEEPAIADEAIEEEAVVEEVAPVAPIAPVEEKKAPAAPFEFSLLLRPYAAMNFDWAGDKVYRSTGIGLGLSFDFDNIAAFNENSGFGLRLDVGSTQYPLGIGFTELIFGDLTGNDRWAFWNWQWGEMVDLVNNYEHDLNTTLLLTIDARAGVMDVSLGLGGGAALLFNATDANYHFEYDKFSLAAYGAANLGLKFYCGNVFSIGVDAVYKVMIPNYENNELDASLVLGFTF